MVGIVACGVYVPRWRLDLKALGIGRGERAIGNYDEDSLTMGVAAAVNCLSTLDRGQIDGLFFATTTSPYKEKPISVTAALALDLREDILTADFANSLRAGTTALKAAADTVKAGSAKQIIVIASDMRIPTPGSEFERLFGDGAVAFIVGDDNVKAIIRDSYSIADEILDIWRADDDKYVRSWEARFTLDEGYFRVMPKAALFLMEKNSLTPKDFSKAVFYGPEGRRHQEMAKKLGFDITQIQDPMFGVLGETGTAFTLMMLAAAFETAKIGDRIIAVSYGNGADALLIEVTKQFEVNHGIKNYLETKGMVVDYKVYLRWRQLIEMVTGRRRPPLPTPSASAIWRERDQNIRLRGVKCNQCGTVQYPVQRICFNCHAKDNFESYLFSDKKGKLVTFTADYMTPTPDPPVVLTVVNVDGGGRLFLTMTDKDENEINIGMPLELTFRKLFSMDGIHNYFWKSMPIRF
ncbi:OB-fold domain-containing protein [Chloroflexota bacterium]